jgi:hypothetical protein
MWWINWHTFVIKGCQSYNYKPQDLDLLDRVRSEFVRRARHHIMQSHHINSLTCRFSLRLWTQKYHRWESSMRLCSNKLKPLHLINKLTTFYLHIPTFLRLLSPPQTSHPLITAASFFLFLLLMLLNYKNISWLHWKNPHRNNLNFC